MSRKWESCKHNEGYHHYPNPLAVARHYCKICNQEIEVVHHVAWLPKECYFNGYFEETDDVKRKREERYKSRYTFIQVE